MTTEKNSKRMLREYSQRRACLAPAHPDDVFFQSHAELPSFTLLETGASSETLPVTGASSETLPVTGASSETLPETDTSVTLHDTNTSVTLPETDTSATKRRQRRTRMFGDLHEFSGESFGVLFVSKARPRILLYVKGKTTEFSLRPRSSL